MANTTKSTTNLPSYIEQPTQAALGKIQSWMSPGNMGDYVYGMNGESLSTPMSAQQNKAIGNIQGLADSDLRKTFGLDKSDQLWDVYSGADQSSVNDRMNPYLKGVLDPTVRELQQEDERQRNSIGAQAQMSGAFGDARHGIMEGEQSERTNQAISDASAKIYSQGYDDLMNRVGTAAQGAASNGQQYYDMTTGVNDALFNAGTAVQQNQEKARSAQQEYAEAMANRDYDRAIKLLAAAQGAPMSTTQKQTQSSDDGLWGLAGSVLGGLF